MDNKKEKINKWLNAKASEYAKLETQKIATVINKLMINAYIKGFQEATTMMYKHNHQNKQNVEYPDCNQCGDYERCAFHYDECTGFIPK